jgi:hypothetical protein
MKTEVNIYWPDPSTGCTCGPYWSVVPPPPCPHHAFKVYPPAPGEMTPKELAALYRRMADALDPPESIVPCTTTRTGGE